MRFDSEGKSAIREPDTSSAAFKIPSEVNRVESVCNRSLGSRILMRTRRSSSMEGKPSEKVVNLE